VSALVQLSVLSKEGVAIAQRTVTEKHYLRKPVDSRCSVEGYYVSIGGMPVGVFILRPAAGDEVLSLVRIRRRTSPSAAPRSPVGRCSNLARVYFDPCVQAGGDLHTPARVPGFHDRRGAFRSTFGSTAIAALADRVVLEYLIARPPCFLEEPYQLRWLLSYCDTRVHRGALYRAAGFELFRTNEDGIETWRLPLRPLTADEDRQVREASASNPRSIEYRRRRVEACA